LYPNDQNEMVNVYYPILYNYSILKINMLLLCCLCYIKTSSTLGTKAANYTPVKCESQDLQRAKNYNEQICTYIGYQGLMI